MKHVTVVEERHLKVDLSVFNEHTVSIVGYINPISDGAERKKDHSLHKETHVEMLNSGV